MFKFFKRISKRLYYKFLIWLRNIKEEEKTKTTETQKMCLSICRSMIVHPDSIFTIAPLSGKRYIKNPTMELFVILDERVISITNHIYHYDVVLDDKNWCRISNMYDQKTEAIRQDYENEIMSQIENSLSKIQGKIKMFS